MLEKLNLFSPLLLHHQQFVILVPFCSFYRLQSLSRWQNAVHFFNIIRRWNRLQIASRINREYLYKIFRMVFPMIKNTILSAILLVSATLALSYQPEPISVLMHLRREWHQRCIWRRELKHWRAVITKEHWCI